MAHSLTSRRLLPWSTPTYVVLLGAAVAAAGPYSWLGALGGLVAAVWAGVCRVSWRVAALAVAPLVLALGVPWPAPAVLASALFWTGGVRSARPPTVSTARADGCGARAVGETLVAATVCAPVAAGLAYLSWADEHPAVELAPPHPALLALGVVLLALVNAASEEWFWRGCAVRLLEDDGAGYRATVLVQASSFGVAHAAGLPGGGSGVAGAFVLGLVLGVLRLRPAGMAGCVAVHTAVDAALFGLVANQVVWVG